MPQPTRLQPEPPPDLAGGEYAVLDLPDGWPVASLICFVAALGARFFTGALPDGLFGLRGPVLTAFAVPAIAALGLALGLIGLKSRRGRGMARIGLLLNGAVIALSALALWAFFYILPD